MFTSRDLLSELARYPNKADGLKVKARDFMIPLNRMIYCSMKDSLYQCLLVMSELKVNESANRPADVHSEELRKLAGGWGCIGEVEWIERGVKNATQRVMQLFAGKKRTISVSRR